MRIYLPTLLWLIEYFKQLTVRITAMLFGQPDEAQDDEEQSQ